MPSLYNFVLSCYASKNDTRLLIIWCIRSIHPFFYIIVSRPFMHVDPSIKHEPRGLYYEDIHDMNQYGRAHGRAIHSISIGGGEREAATSLRKEDWLRSLEKKLHRAQKQTDRHARQEVCVSCIWQSIVMYQVCMGMCI